MNLFMGRTCLWARSPCFFIFFALAKIHNTDQHVHLQVRACCCVLSLHNQCNETIALLPAQPHTALLIFSRSAAGESVFKPLLRRGTAVQRYAVANLFINFSRRVARQTDFPVFEISERAQRGGTFGERFADAFRQVFEQGYDRVIAIGNDCPALTAKDILRAAAHLEQSHMVFGPAADGGAYLVGLRREAFAERVFADLAWQTDHTLAALKAHADGDFQLLSEKSDVDSAADLQRALRAALFPVLLKKRLLGFLSAVAVRWENIFFKPTTALLLALTLRGP
jgi:uncharacterized protein